jgi:hypothetical protein
MVAGSYLSPVRVDPFLYWNPRNDRTIIMRRRSATSHRYKAKLILSYVWFFVDNYWGLPILNTWSKVFLSLVSIDIACSASRSIYSTSELIDPPEDWDGAWMAKARSRC